MRICCGRNLRHPAGASPALPQGRFKGAERGAGERGEARAGSARKRRRGRMAKRMRMRGGAGRQHRAAPAPQTQARRPRREAFSRRRRIELGADRARENHRESAADSRKQARRPAQGARTAKRQGVTAISRLPNPRDARRNARSAPSRRAPGIGRTYTAHEAVGSGQWLVLSGSRNQKLETRHFVFMPEKWRTFKKRVTKHLGRKVRKGRCAIRLRAWTRPRGSPAPHMRRRHRDISRPECPKV